MPTDILFVNLPPYESYFAEGVPHLGMLYVLTSLRDHGYTASYLDCARRTVRHSHIVSAIREAQPRMIGFSVDSDNLISVGNFTRDLKREMGADIPIILGGPASQGDAREIMERSAADVLVIGEGEHTAREVADCLLQRKGALDDIPGICYRSPGGLVTTTPRPPIADLDAIAFPDHSFLPNPERYEASIISGRGCPFRCTFCFEGRMGNTYRHRSPENIVDEMERLLASHRKPLFISILDDTFTANPEHTRRLCKLMQQRFRPWEDLLWFCEVRVDVIRRHPDLVEEMAKAGVARIQIGAESADEGMLRSYKRLNVKPHVVEEVVGAFHRAGVPSIYCGFIIGGPGETMDTVRTTTDFAKHLLLDVAPGSFECNASFLTPLPGTELRRSPEAYGLRLLDPDLLTTSNFNFPVTETPELSLEMVNNLRWKFIDEVDVAIKSTIPSLSRETIQKHWKLDETFAIRTAYRQRFGAFPRLVEYLNLVGDGKFESADTLPDDALLERFPTRLSYPIWMEDGNITVTKGPTVLKLNGLGSRVFALSSGKLRVREIVSEVASQLGDVAPDREVLQSDVLSYFRHLDENYAIFLKDF